MDSYVDVGDDELRPPLKDMRNGIYNTFHPNGMLKTMVHYCDDEVEGPFTALYNNGIMDLKGRFTSGKNLVGFHIKHHPSDYVYAYRFFDTSGQLHGISKTKDKASWWHHGAPKTYFIEHRDYVRYLWIRAGTHHIIIRIVQCTEISKFNLTLYAPSSIEKPPFIVCKRKMPINKFTVIMSEGDYRRYTIFGNRKPDFPKIYIEELMSWDNIQIPFWYSEYTSIAEDILGGIENPYSAMSIVSSIFRFLSKYGAYIPSTVKTFNEFVAKMESLEDLKKIDEGATHT